MKLILFLLLLIISGCNVQKLPPQKLNQYDYRKNYSVDEDQIEVNLGNPLYCPLRVWMQSSDSQLNDKFTAINPLVLQARSDTVLLFQNIENQGIEINFASRLGDVRKSIQPIPLELPFKAGKQYRIIQGNNSTPTHNTDWSRYAVDFSLAEKDTICAALDGYVVGVIEAYQHGGPEEKWKPFGNYITTYHPESGLFLQYVHLIHQGSFVEVGDNIKAGDPIALSGKTGQTNIEHLHFNCLVPENSENGLKSIPVEFKGGYLGKALKRGDLVAKKGLP